MNDHTTAPAVTQNYPELPNSAENSDELSDKQRLAIELLLQGKSLSAVAASVPISRKTLFNWRQDERFIAALEQRRRELWDGAAERLRALVHPALDVLEQEVHDEFDLSRVRAANMILKFANLRKSVPPPAPLNDVHERRCW